MTRELAQQPRDADPARAALLVAVLAAPWLLNPSLGPTPQVPQACMAALALLAWIVGRDGMAPATQVRVLAWAWLLAATLSALLGIAQYAGIVPTSFGWIAAASTGEAVGNLRQRNQLASLLALGFSSALFLGVDRPAMRRWVLAAVVVVSIALPLTSSRTGLLQFGLVAGAAMLLGRRREARRWLFAASAGAWLAIACTYLAAPILLAHFTGAAAPTLVDRVSGAASCTSRAVLWSNALHLAARHPWTGWGLGEFDYAHYATLYPGERFCLIVDNAHNLFLQIAVELGWPIAGLAAAALSWIVLRAKPWRERVAGRILCWVALALILLHSMVEYPLWYGPFQLAAILAGLHLWSTGPAAAPAMSQGTSPLRWMFGGLACAAIVYVAWDYHRMSQLYLPAAARSPAYRDDPLSHARASVLFRSQVQFAEFTTTPLTRSNASAMAALGERVLHYSPEPKVITKTIEALVMTRDDARAQWHLERLRAGFPVEYRGFVSRAQPASR